MTEKQIEAIVQKYVEWNEAGVRRLINRLEWHQADGEQARTMLQLLGGSKLLDLTSYNIKPRKRRA
ncbi:MAG TPA: hypothetical protein VK681_12705 [Reyranella sp.]|nr:hypothetical protein [Reyranella sp.]